MRKKMILLVIATLTIISSSAGFAAEEPQMIQVTTQNYLDTHPTWSSDGQSIFFISDKPGGLGIYQASPSANAQITPVTEPESRLVCDMWLDVNRQGQMIFASTRNTGQCKLYTMKAGDKDPVMINLPVQVAQFPSWSPDGKRIAFASAEEKNKWQIWTAAADGSDAKKLTAGVHPRWSPDGKKIIFANESASRNWDIYSINTDGTGLTRLTSDPDNELEPDWSPDGKRIIYVSVPSNVPIELVLGTSRHKAKCSSALVVKDIDSTVSTKVNLVPSTAFNVHPRWSPDGQRIVFASDKAGNMDIWVMAL